MKQETQYWKLVNGSEKIKNQAGKLSEQEMIDKLKKIGFGQSKATELAKRWFNEAETKKAKDAEMKAAHDKWLAKVKEKDEKYSKKGNLAQAFTDAWNKKDLGVKAKYVED